MPGPIHVSHVGQCRYVTPQLQKTELGRTRRNIPEFQSHCLVSTQMSPSFFWHHFVCFYKLGFPYTVTPNYHCSIKLPSSLLVNDLSPTAQRKQRLQQEPPPHNFLFLDLFLYLSLPPLFLASKISPFGVSSFVQIFLGL